MDRQPAVYMLASGRAGTLYVGVTSDLTRRLHQHRTGSTVGFASRYGVMRLVWFEMHETMEAAIAREKRIKGWRRDRKMNLIEAGDPAGDDLALGFGFAPLA